MLPNGSMNKIGEFIYFIYVSLKKENTGWLPHNDDNVEVRDNVTIAYIYIYYIEIIV